MSKVVGTIQAVGRPRGVDEHTETSPMVPEGWVLDSGQQLDSDPVMVELDDGQVFSVDPAGERAAETVRLLREFGHALIPVYLEIDDSTGVITRLLLPTAYTVTAVADEPAGDELVVDVMVSHRPHFVSTSNPEYGELVELLRRAQRDQRPVLVTEEPDRPEIIDVRLAEDPPTALLTEPPPVQGGSAVTRSASVLPFVQVQQLFDLLKGADCWSLAAPLTCIPYSYPDDGCWARAHEGARRLIAQGVIPWKVWSYGSRVCRTANSPWCSVPWKYHVAIYVFARLANGVVLPMALDPALFSTPATIDEWLLRQSAPATATIEYTDAAVYLTGTANNNTGVVVHDEYYASTELALINYRGQLRTRSMLSNPPGPPYACP